MKRIERLYVIEGLSAHPCGGWAMWSHAFNRKSADHEVAYQRELHPNMAAFRAVVFRRGRVVRISRKVRPKGD